MVKKRKHISFSDLLFEVVVYGILIIALLVVAIPILHVASSSFSSPDAILSGQVFLWPKGFSLEGYKAVFSYDKIWRGYGNSLFYTLLGTSINVVLTTMIAYPLSRKDLVGRNQITMLVTFTMLFSGGMIPTYIVVNSLGLVGTFWSLILPTSISAYYVIIARTFFQQNIPDELKEAAEIDGATNFKMIGMIVLPLSKSIMAVLTLFYAVGHWNSYFSALLYIRDETLYPLQLVLRGILLLNQTSVMVNTDSLVEAERLQALLQYGTIVVSTIPMLIIYPFVQKHFVKGVMIGSVKG